MSQSPFISPEQIVAPPAATRTVSQSVIRISCPLVKTGGEEKIEILNIISVNGTRTGTVFSQTILAIANIAGRHQEWVAIKSVAEEIKGNCDTCPGSD